jgi:hypothetical protein
MRYTIGTVLAYGRLHMLLCSGLEGLARDDDNKKESDRERSLIVDRLSSRLLAAIEESDDDRWRVGVLGSVV